jgi:hypothetical protein
MTSLRMQQRSDTFMRVIHDRRLGLWRTSITVSNSINTAVALFRTEKKALGQHHVEATPDQPADGTTSRIPLKQMMRHQSYHDWVTVNISMWVAGRSCLWPATKTTVSMEAYIAELFPSSSAPRPGKQPTLDVQLPMRHGLVPERFRGFDRWDLKTNCLATLNDVFHAIPGFDLCCLLGFWECCQADSRRRLIG